MVLGRAYEERGPKLLSFVLDNRSGGGGGRLTRCELASWWPRSHVAGVADAAGSLFI